MSTQRLWPKFVFATVLSLGMLSGSSVMACPMCKIANETGQESDDAAKDDRPLAYMYSIIVMLSMPASMTAGIGYSLYRMNKHETQIAESLNDNAESAE